MPELPEVETVRMQLRAKVVGKTVSAVEVFHSKTVGHDATIEDVLLHQTIADIERVGKLLIFSFVDAPDTFLLAHLKMTGQFFFVEGSEIVTGGGHTMSDKDVTEFPGRHTRVAFNFTDGTALYFNDMRLFGYTKVVNRVAVEEARLGFGPEPTDDTFDVSWFTDAIRKRRTSVKAALLDQSFVAGLGNIYVDEALWRARVSPQRKTNTLTQREARTIAHASRDVMLESIALGGTTFKNFVDTKGRYGNFKDKLKVFGRNGSLCERCGEVIVKIRCAGRGTHYCLGCQK